MEVRTHRNTKRLALKLDIRLVRPLCVQAVTQVKPKTSFIFTTLSQPQILFSAKTI